MDQIYEINSQFAYYQCITRYTCWQISCGQIKIIITQKTKEGIIQNLR